MDLLDTFRTFDVARVQQYVSAQQEEHLLLDFKTVTRPDLTASDDKRSFARALSGFANSSGGIILWGVDARKLTPDGPDCACGTQEVTDLPTFLSRLNEFTGAFVRPFVEGVLHRGIPASATQGFAITLVPESEAGPHMALGGEGRYFKRSGSSFYPMEHFDIEDICLAVAESLGCAWTCPLPRAALALQAASATAVIRSRSPLSTGVAAPRESVRSGSRLRPLLAESVWAAPMDEAG
jgi:hypothetical protein